MFAALFKNLNIKNTIAFCLLFSLNSHASFYSPEFIARLNREGAIRALGWNADFFRFFGIKSGYGEIDDALKDKRLYKVTEDYGKTKIVLRDLPFRSEVAIAKNVPWSSYWYPKSDDLIFRSNDNKSSPLEKLDLVRKARSRDTIFGGSPESAAAWEKENSFDPSGPKWFGLCDAWTIASISYPEPTKPVTINNVTFSVGDVKALVLKTFEDIDEKQTRSYGVKFLGNNESWIYPDIFPDQFHRFIEMQLFRDQKAFLMDHDAGVEIWSVPVFKANYVMEQDPRQPDQVKVTLWLYNAAQMNRSNQRDFVGTEVETREYNYILKGTPNAQGELVIDSGIWIKGDRVDSRKDHPDYMVTIPNPADLTRVSKNPNIDTSLVDSIAKASFK